MAFNRNPFVPKARAAEQKANDAPDDASRVRAHRDAAHQWDRAAERETPGKQRAEYERLAAENRRLADGEPALLVAEDPPPEAEPAPRARAIDPRALN